MGILTDLGSPFYRYKAALCREKNTRMKFSHAAKKMSHRFLGCPNSAVFAWVPMVPWDSTFDKRHLVIAVSGHIFKDTYGNPKKVGLKSMNTQGLIRPWWLLRETNGYVGGVGWPARKIVLMFFFELFLPKSANPKSGTVLDSWVLGRCQLQSLLCLVGWTEQQVTGDLMNYGKVSEGSLWWSDCKLTLTYTVLNM